MPNRKVSKKERVMALSSDSPSGPSGYFNCQSARRGLFECMPKPAKANYKSQGVPGGRQGGVSPSIEFSSEAALG